ncbi:hypothetical protein WME91_26385 [Sorangium sp. So ce269]
MEQTVVTVFDDVMSDMALSGGTYFITKYTSLEHTDVLSSAGQIGLQAVMQEIWLLKPLPLTITMEHSANGYDWKPKHSAPELSGWIYPGNDTVALAGGESWPTRPSLRFVRLRIDIGDEQARFSAALKVHATVRRRGAGLLDLDEDVDEDDSPKPLPLAELLFGVRGEVLDELRELALNASHVDEEARHAEVIGRMSLRSKREVFGLVRRIQGMDVESKQLLLSLGRGVVKLLSAELGEGEEGKGAEHAPGPASRPVAQDERERQKADAESSEAPDRAPLGDEPAGADGDAEQPA